jgi:hypothetical protein|tara:strand:+ start:8253 stop:8447 length:195 start_codon:yes stop_codon:yes gene_type:complete
MGTTNPYSFVSALDVIMVLGNGVKPLKLSGVFPVGLEFYLAAYTTRLANLFSDVFLLKRPHPNR